jgi:hypothetical protein
MHDWSWRSGLAAIAVSLCVLPAPAPAAGHVAEYTQAASGSGRGAAESGRPQVADSLAKANSPEQIEKAQAELRRLECLKGRVDGRLGDQTRRAVMKFWTSAGQPAAQVDITDELISDLAERGDGFCRPARKFFAARIRSNPNSALPALFAPGSRPNRLPVTAPPLSPAVAH